MAVSVHSHPAPDRTWRIGWQLDLRDLPRSHHTSLIFERLDALAPDAHLSVVWGYSPQTLRRQIEAWCPDEFRWTWTTAGPIVWRAQITRKR